MWIYPLTVQLYSYAHTVRETTANNCFSNCSKKKHLIFTRWPLSLHKERRTGKEATCNNFGSTSVRKFRNVSASLECGIEITLKVTVSLTNWEWKWKKLKADDCSKRMEFSFWLLENLDILSQISWADQVCLHSNRYKLISLSNSVWVETNTFLNEIVVSSKVNLQFGFSCDF